MNRRILIGLSLGLAWLAAGCAQPEALSFYDGQFVGPVVARRDTPPSPNYKLWCGEAARPWRYGYYRQFTPCPRDEGWTRRPGDAG